MKIFRNFGFVSTLCVAAIGLTSISLAQDTDPVEPLNLSDQPVVLEFSSESAGPPTVEPLTDGRMTFRIEAVGEISGAFAGHISAKVSEVTSMPSPPFHAVSVMFTIETENGVIEAYYDRDVPHVALAQSLLAAPAMPHILLIAMCATTSRGSSHDST